LFYLKQLGWEESRNEVGEPILLLPTNKVNKQRLQQEIERFQRELKQIVTVIPSFFSTVIPKYSVELLYFLALEFRSILINVISSPEERNFRSIDMESESYELLFKPVVEVVDVLTAFGFNVHPSGIYRIVENPDLKLFQAGVIDINKVIQQLVISIPIFQALQRLFANNPAKTVKAFYEAFLDVLQK